MKRKLIIFSIISVFLINIFYPIKVLASPDESSEGRESNEEKNDNFLKLESTSAVLIEGSTGKIIYEKNKDERLYPASITKIMTLLLIYQALEEGKFTLNDEVSVSEHAASLGGSQVFLEPYEVQTVETMIKCIAIASANDASVAMAEFVAGTEEEFINRMNTKAKELGMNNTNFVNSYGLDADGHFSTAYDVALMSKELVGKYPEISNYSTIWMDTIIHKTKKGESEFGLNNTNRLVRFYEGVTGLKTGSTGLAKYCLSATANRDGMDLIAVVLAAPSTKIRFNEGAKLLDYGFANYELYIDDNKDLEITPIPIGKGVKDDLNYKVQKDFTYLCDKDTNPEEISKSVRLEEKVNAPININDRVGEVVYSVNNKEIGKVDILAAETVEKAKYKNCLSKAFSKFTF